MLLRGIQVRCELVLVESRREACAGIPSPGGQAEARLQWRSGFFSAPFFSTSSKIRQYGSLGVTAHFPFPGFLAGEEGLRELWGWEWRCLWFPLTVKL